MNKLTWTMKLNVWFILWIMCLAIKVSDVRNHLWAQQNVFYLKNVMFKKHKLDSENYDYGVYCIDELVNMASKIMHDKKDIEPLRNYLQLTLAYRFNKQLNI